MKRLGLAAAALLAAVQAAPAQQPSSGEAPAAAVAPMAPLLRQIALSELGYASGFGFVRLTGQAEVFFPLPLPAAVQEARLVLEFTHGTPTPTDRFLRIAVGGRNVASVNLSTTPSPARIEIPADVALAQGGQLRVTLTYSGALTERSCMDLRSAGDFLEVLPQSGLQLTLDPAALDSPAAVAGFAPQRMQLELPPSVTPEVLAAALRAGTLFGAERGLVGYGDAPAQDGWSASQAVLAPGEGANGALGLEWQDGVPRLMLGGADPQQALALLAGSDAGLALAPVTGAQLSPATTTGERTVALDRLSGAQPAKPVVERESFDFAFDIADLPAGTVPRRATLFVAAAPDAEGDGATAAVSLNGTLLGSQTLHAEGPQRLDVEVPAGLTGRDNLLRVEVLRQPRGGDCSLAPQGYPAQVLPGSELILKRDTGRIEDFHTLRHRMTGGVELRLDPGAEVQAAALLPVVAPVLAAVVPGAAPIRTADAGTLPFVVISATVPQGTDPAVRLDQGRLELRTPEGRVIYTGEQLERLTLVQLVRSGDRDGLWIRPGAEAPRADLLHPLVLDRGDLAVIGAEGVLLATSSTRTDLMRIVQPDRFGLVEALGRYWPWIIAALWLAISVLVLQVLQRLYRAWRPASK